MPENKTRLVVIGGGPGGYVAAIRAAQLGAEVTLVEKAALGGTCLNVGCIPTKALLHTAFLYEDMRAAGRRGINAQLTLDFAAVQTDKRRIVERLVGGVGSLMKSNGITVITGTAAFASPRSLTVTGAGEPRILEFDRAIIAAGSAPAVPPVSGVDLPVCLDSTGALALETVPETLAIIGGGVIGIEMAAVYSAFGTKVSVIEMMDEILPFMDAEPAKTLRRDMAKKGVVFNLKSAVTSIEETNGKAAVRLSSDQLEDTLTVDRVLVAVGRKPETSGLNLDAAGINVDGGRIVVNDRMETNVPGIYAAGDCTGGLLLAHVASVQGEVAAENALGHTAVFNAATTPFCVYGRPEFAGVGLTEAKALEQGLDITIGRFPFAANGKALIEGETSGQVKIIAGKRYGEILGVHILGPGATDLIAEGALAIGCEATLDEIIATIHAHPTLSEAVREAALAAEGRALHLPRARK
ncbi:MAG: dihydrolipoyl dehydrogenase [Methylobacteriaceae bacterium]|jgi:dihydrolipoamide dehydrogenase|nr:dihydrolipoyl dehydrogenase [Methylobacteriaceae bacterium]